MIHDFSHKVTKLTVDKETLNGSGTTLTSFLLPLGSNIYVLSYPRNGNIYHTVIDTGFFINHDLVIRLFESNGIDFSHIENIFLTHHHGDHCGLAKVLATKSGARIMVPEAFQDLIIGLRPNTDKFHDAYFIPTSLKDSNLKGLKPEGKFTLSGLDFPLLGEFPLAKTDRLTVLACPQSQRMHTDDQIVILYSQSKTADSLSPKHEILFSGDLWLMDSPDFKANLKLRIGFIYRRFIRRYFSRDGKRISPQEEDIEAKEALKRSFAAIRVKPGHGKEFLGARILPNSILCSKELHEKGRSLKMDEGAVFCNAYQLFCEELLYLRRTDCSEEKTLNFLGRLYKEQSGGSKSVRRDRSERRAYLKLLLGRLSADESKPETLRDLASDALASIKKTDGLTSN